MILIRNSKKDLLRSRGTMAVVFAFIFLSALLMAGGIGLIVTLNGALDALFDAARVPDVVQMHAGDLDRGEIDEWAGSHPLIERYQTVEMITVDSDTLYIGSTGVSERGSVMDISIVPPNRDFDLLLDETDRIYEPQPGEIGVPVYYAQRDNLTLGEEVTLRTESWTTTFRIGAFIRDAQMNPSIIHSKRLVVHEDDYTGLRQLIPETEYLIAFRLTDPEETDRFITDYQATGLPQTGPIVDRQIFRTLNALSDGIVGAVIVVLSVILIVIAILCLRFTILASIEEDYQEIGVMKAIGMHRRYIRRIFLAKYIALGTVASVAGYALSFPLASIPGTAIAASVGSPAPGAIQYIAPAVGAAIVLLIVLVSCIVIIGRIERISAVEALRGAGAHERPGRRWGFGLSGARRMNVNVHLGLMDVLQRFRLFALLCVIFIFATLTIIVPVHFLSTITSPSFISYMGIGQSDIRIDLRQTEEMERRYEAMIAHLENDPEVERYAELVTAQYTLVQENGERETIAIETGDVSQFPLDYLTGRAPTTQSEIALSYLNAGDLAVENGDSVTLLIDGTATVFTVSGIYQDVTNGGRTAKARIPYEPESVLWYSVSADFTAGVSVRDKAERYTHLFAPARVTDLAGYMKQTLGTTISRLRTVTIVAIVVGLGVSALITSLFLQMLIRKDAIRIAIQRSLGFGLYHIRIQYVTTALAVLGIGVTVGTIFSNTLGPKLIGFLWSFMGASRISFVIEPLRAYVGIPLLFIAAVAATTQIALAGIKKIPGGIQ